MNAHPPSPPARGAAVVGRLWTIAWGLAMVLFGISILTGNLGFGQYDDDPWASWAFRTGNAMLGVAGLLLAGVFLLLAGVFLFLATFRLIEKGFVRLLDTNRRVAARLVLVLIVVLILVLLGGLFWALWDVSRAFGQALVPALVVLVGAIAVWRGLAGPGPAVSADGEGDTQLHPHTSPYVFTWALLGFHWRCVQVGPFKWALLAAHWGGVVHLDLSQATLGGETARIVLSLLMGRAEIIVPPDWEVLVRPSVMGACHDLRRAASPAPARRLTVGGVAVMSRVAIKD